MRVNSISYNFNNHMFSNLSFNGAKRKNNLFAYKKNDIKQEDSDKFLKGKDKDIFEIKHNENNSLTYNELGEKYGLSESRAYTKARNSEIKIKILNDDLTKEEKQYIEDFSKTFNINKEITGDIISREYAITYYTPKDLKKRIDDTVKAFEKEGLIVESYLPACIRQPALFTQHPDTIEKNVRDLVDKFKDEGLTVESYLPACIRQQSLFVQSPDTIEKNVRDLVDKFKGEGLTVEQYIPACLKRPQLFCQSPETIEKNVRDIVDKFKNEGLTVEDYLPACIKQPPLFTQSPETIGEHIDILKFCNSNSKDPMENSDFWNYYLGHPINLSCSSSYLLIKNLIIPKMFEDTCIPKELRGNKQKEKLSKYLAQHPNQKYIINIKNIDCESDCIEILKKTLDNITKNAKVDKDTFIIREG